MITLHILNSDLLDGDWIYALLGIAFSIILFAFGVPFLFMQTFVNESFRPYIEQTDSFIKIRNRINYLTIFSVIVFVLLLNPLIKHIIEEHSCTNIASEKTSSGTECEAGCIVNKNSNTGHILPTKPEIYCNSNYHFLIGVYFAGIVLLMIVFLLSVYNLFIGQKIILNYKKSISDHYFSEIKAASFHISYLNSNEVENLVHAYASNGGSNIFVNSALDYSLKILNSDTYNGKELTFYFKHIYYEYFVINFNYRNWSDFGKLITLLNQYSKNQIVSTDLENIDRKFIPDLAIQSVNGADERPLGWILEMITSFPVLPRTYLRIFRSLFEAMQFQNVYDLSIRLAQSIDGAKSTYYNEEIKNVLIYVTSNLLYISDGSKVAVATILKTSNIDANDILFAENCFTETSDYECFNLIQKSKSELIAIISGQQN
jgi:ABC-type multidrug transport system fused ATPase/permease subunit